MNGANDKGGKERFPKEARLLKQHEFDRVHRQNIFAADKMLVVKATCNGLDRTRLGLSVSRRVGNAVVRNRWKRCIRESFRRQQHSLPTGLDIVVRPRKGAYLRRDEVMQSLNRLTAKLKQRLKKTSRR